jgi:phosphate transport system permease protein
VSQTSSISAPQNVPEKREMHVVYSLGDRIFRRIVTAGALTSLIILALIGLFLFARGAEIFRDMGPKFITGVNWATGSEDGTTAAEFSIGPMLVGTIIVSIIALIVALPLSIAGALFIEFYSSQRLKRTLVSLLDLAAAIPSIFFGLWGIQIFSSIAEKWSFLLNSYLGWFPLFSNEMQVFGRSPFVAGLVLAAMIAPIITSISREVYSRTPRELVDTCYALGGTRWGAIRTVVMPFGRSGVVGGAMLGLGRALGETVAVYLILNLVFAYNFNILEAQGGNIASLIATRFGEATPYELKGLLAAGFVLFLLTLSVNMIATSVVQRAGRDRS